MSVINKYLSTAILAGAFVLPALVQAVETRSLSFSPTDEVIVNPERGLFHHLEFNSNDNEAISANYLRRIRENDGMSLVFTVYIMSDFRNGSDISQQYLERIRSNMKMLRQEGFKTILRFCYSYGENDYPRDVPWYLCQRHIEQLTPILQENSDVIAVLEAGFVGAWGEWYYTDNYGMNPKTFDDYAPRKEVLTSLLNAMPKSRFVSVRYPAAKLGVFRLGTPQTININTAYNESDVSRTGFHNDCFLADEDDMGTFGYNQHYRQYWKTESQFVPMGGETCAPPNIFTEELNAQQAFADYHWSYLNKDYHGELISAWESNNFLRTIRKNLGYRLVLKDGECDEYAVGGTDFNLKLKIENEGWAAPFNPRDLEIVFKPDNKYISPYVYKVEADPRFWFPGTTTELEATVPIPSKIPSGEYTVCLNLPDPCESLHNDPRYSIRLANDGLWDEATGYNNLCKVSIIENSGIDDIRDNSGSLVNVYNPQGVLIRKKVDKYTALDGLPHGVYIIDGKKILK